jgi:hypothetical protein
MGQALDTRINLNPKEGTTLLKFIYGQPYNGKLAKRYGNTPTDEFPLCHKPESCTQIAGECSDHEALRINRHNSAFQLVHDAIRKTAKGGGTLYKVPGLVLIAADTGSYSKRRMRPLSHSHPPWRRKTHIRGR